MVWNDRSSSITRTPSRRPVVWWALLIPAILASPAWKEHGIARADDRAAFRSDLTLPAPEDFEDEAVFMRSIAVRAEKLTKAAEQTGDHLNRADLFLAAANLVLAQEVEPACTRRVLQLPADTRSASDESVRDALSRANLWLTRAKSELDSLGRDDPAPEVAASRQRYQILETFGVVIAAYLIPAEGPEAERAGREAASRLSILLESPNSQILAAATFWQAALRDREGDASRVLSMLELALADPPRNSLPFSFFARLLRCRMLAANGNHAAAMALLTQMEERGHGWMIGDRDAEDAGRAISVVEIQVLQDWQDRFMGPWIPKEREWFSSRIEGLKKDRFSESHRMYRLRPAIPIVANVPEGRLDRDK